MDFDILRSFFVIRYFRSKCSSVEMQKGDMVRESLGTFDQAELIIYMEEKFLVKDMHSNKYSKATSV